MESLNSLLVLGLILSFGAISSKLLKWIKLPQVIGYILIGLFVGISGIKLINYENIDSFKLIIDLSLGLVGLGIGGELRWARLKRFEKNCYDYIFRIYIRNITGVYCRLLVY